MPQEKNVFSEWLETLQQESWQLELLISGFAIYGFFQILDFTQEFSSKIYNFPDRIVGMFLIILVAPIFLGTLIFIANLLIHVFVRGLWIGAIGLRYVSGEIDYEAFNYNKRFTDFYKRKVGSFDNYIEKLEKFASSIFSYTFLLFFILLSITIFISYLLLITYIFSILSSGDSGTAGLSYNLEQSPTLKMICYSVILVHVLLGLIVSIDFIGLGFLKRIKNKFFSFCYYWVFRYIGFITVSFLLRPIFLNFINNTYTRRLFWMAIPYGIFLFAILPSANYRPLGYIPDFPTHSSMYKQKSKVLSEIYLPSHYDEEILRLDDDDNSRHVRFCSVPSKRMTGKLGQIFYKTPTSIDLFIRERHPQYHQIYNTGFQTVLSSDKIENTSKSTAETRFHKNLKEYEKEYKSKNSNLSIQESKKRWYKERRHKIIAFRDSLAQVEKNQLIDIKQIIKSTMKMKIDENHVSDTLIECDFYIHPELDNKGLLCFYPLDSLSTGRHYLNLSFLDFGIPNNQLIIDTIDVSIPFIYE